ncbi:MAG: antibiotic biosynthesis monooxygenase [Saprospiraceae bacterium]|nr:antibiotic biosynthesis monooxygenase [Saprospiraceae bacterium]
MAQEKKHHSPPPALADTPPPPYYAVIFSTLRTEGDQGYGEMAEKMAALAATMPGYLGAESARDGVGITVSYWKDLESIKNWKYRVEHVVARDMGREIWYQSYRLRIALVERDYGFEKR